MKLATLLQLAVLFTAASAIPATQNNGNTKNKNNKGTGTGTSTGTTTSANNAQATSSASANTNSNDLTLLAANVQDASESTGQAGATEAGQANSATDNANFINFCTGKTLTNGAQVTGGSCNGIVMGDIPSQSNMISSVITSPGPAEDIAANTPFTVNVKVANLVAGSFTSEPPLDEYWEYVLLIVMWNRSGQYILRCPAGPERRQNRRTYTCYDTEDQ
jgi:hypothetical protein